MAQAYDASSSSLHPPSTLENQPLPLPRVDSPLESAPLMPDSTSSTQSIASAADAASCSPESGSHAAKSHSTPTKDQRPRGTSNSNASLHFLVVDHPAKLKDKVHMRELRQHVMHDYLDKERRNPGSTDARVTGSANASKKRKRLEAHPPGYSSNPLAPASIFGPRQTSVSSIHSATSSNGSLDGPNRAAPTIEQNTPSRKTAQTTPRRPVRFFDDIAPLMRGIAGGLNNSRYLKTPLDDIPNPTSYVGSNLNPFDTWPTLSDPMCNVEALKWCCSRRFGSQGLSDHWVPTLLKAKHAFLSTICISSSHEDIMRRGMQAPHERLQHGSRERTQSRLEVILLINQAMKDDTARIADTTIIAVLQLLNAEIMGCDGQVMRIHQQGLHGMVRERGGLENLGVEGQLASILTITMFMIAALRETEPHSDFVRYASQKRTRPPHSSDLQPIPESPVYCRLSGYHTIHKSIQRASPVCKLLECLRLLTASFMRNTNSRLISPTASVWFNSPWQQATNAVTTLRDEIFAMNPAEEMHDSFKDPNEKHTYEALRLTAMLYSHALANGIPFFKAAKQLSQRYAFDSNLEKPQSWHILIKSHLQQTDLSDCWSEMAGVLFWATLVAGACANPDSSSVEVSTRDRWDENEEARKWITAVCVRCSILLSFEYVGAILETLKRIVGIEQVLKENEEEFGTFRQSSGKDAGREVVRFGRPPVRSLDAGRGTTLFGPAEAPFAQDFMGETA